MTSTLEAPATSTTARADAFAADALAALREVIIKHDMTYAEYAAVKQWLIDVGTSGEWPLFLDVWIESTVEAVANGRRDGSKGAILGPFYLPGQVELSTPAEMPRREDEAGSPLTLRGQVRGADGAPLAGARLDTWQADAEGLYSGFSPTPIPDGNLRAVVVADAEGRFEISTVLPAPYQIPQDGPCGDLIRATAWSPYRPAHLHFTVSAPGHQLLTTQLFFSGGDYLDNDVATAVKPELVLEAVPQPGGGLATTYDFVLAQG